MSQTSISYLWREPNASKGFTTGVSLHSHTSQSKETLDFIAELSNDVPMLRSVMSWFEARSIRTSGIRPDSARSYWTPPLPRPPPPPRHIPVSLEWTVPFGATSFHLGVHNLPSATGTEWMNRLEIFTSTPPSEASR